MTEPAYVIHFADIDRSATALVGGKGAHLGELARIDGVRVPPGYVVTTHAYRRIVAGVPALATLLDRLARVAPEDREGIRALSAEIRQAIEATAIPADLAAAITRPLAHLGEQDAYAVRSSATAEDLPTASFAGQQDSFLNVAGPHAILRHAARCWASLFTERAVTYRIRNGYDHRAVGMAVVVQKMVAPEASGVAFTADPVSGNRRIVSVEACFGLGEALVSGTVNADVFTVKDGAVVAREIAAKRVAIIADPAGGTREHAIAPERQHDPALTDEQVIRLAALARRIEGHFGRPQDIEWCLTADGLFEIVQSRPITTLFPVPEAGDREPHVYISVGHQQMMTDAMKPLGLSVFRLTAGRPMYEAGSRLFVDVAGALAAPAGRAALMTMLGRSDPLIGDALQALVDRGDVIPPLPDDAAGDVPAPPPAGEAPPTIALDPAIVADLIASQRASLAALEDGLRAKTGPELIDAILADVEGMKHALLASRHHQALMAGFEASWWLNERLHDWLGEKNPADTLSQSVPNNVTSEMGLALLDVADEIRPYPEVVAFLEQAEGDGFLDQLPALPGGRDAQAAIQRWLAAYGMRCPGEIDITRPRWNERPATILPMILANVRAFAPGEARRRFEHGRQEAAAKEQDLLARLLALPDGERKADETRQRIALLRAFSGYREYPKYAIVNRYAEYRRALMDEAGRLAQSGVLRDPDDVFYLTLPEIRDVVRTQRVDDDLIRERKQAFAAHRALTPPRVLTSDGEVVTGAYRRDGVPPGALLGLPVSAGTVEGRARVILDPEAADLERGDILVTTWTDPSWTPLFLGIAGLVTEVGGQMTHGAVIAREYGLPAVVGVQQATRLIRDGQRIRLHGTDGYVEILPESRQPETDSAPAHAPAGA